MLLCFFVLANMATGCWSRRELNDLGIVIGMGIDKVGDEYEVSVQLVNPGEVSPKKGGAGSGLPVTLFSAKGYTVSGAVTRLTSVGSRRSYFSHIRILLFSEELAKEGIGNILDYISRDHEFRTDFYIAISRGSSAKHMLSILTPLEKIPATKMFFSLEVGEKEWSPVVNVQLDQLINELVAKGKQPVLTGFRISGNKQESGTKSDLEKVQPSANIQTWGLALFKGDKLVGWFNEVESRGYSDLTDKLRRSTLEISCPEDGKMAVNSIRSKSKVSAQIQNGIPVAQVRIRTEADISDVQCKMKLSTVEQIAQIELEVEKEIKKHSESSIQKAKMLRSDVFGFGEAIHREDPVFWNEIKDDWDNRFQQLQIDIHVDVKIRRTGTIGDPVMNKLEQ